MMRFNETMNGLLICSVIHSPEGRRNLMKLSHKMVKNFCQVLNMSDRLDFPHLSELYNSGVRVSLRKSDGIGQPEGLIVSAATSLWLPFSIADLFTFFADENKRAQVVSFRITSLFILFNLVQIKINVEKNEFVIAVGYLIGWKSCECNCSYINWHKFGKLHLHHPGFIPLLFLSIFYSDFMYNIMLKGNKSFILLNIYVRVVK